MFKDKWFILAIIATVFLGLCIVFSGGVYTLGQWGEVRFFRINRFTGETWLGNNLSPRKVEYKSADELPPPPSARKPFADDLGLGAPKAKDK